MIHSNYMVSEGEETIKKRKKMGYGEVTNLILEAIADNLTKMKSYPGPSLPVLLGNILKYVLEVKKQKIKDEKIKRTLHALEKREVIWIEKKEDEIFVHLKDKGEIKVAKYSLRLLLDFKKKQKKWDGKWFLVFFDVPESQRSKRDYLRRFLEQLGFYRYQKSVYLFPYECEEEVKLIKKIVEGAKYMKYIIADKIEDESEAKIFFQLA
ncbi:CRISPR-associated endonuclease Cas2 [Candidatus Roizmanbacteria bacterium RIFCSPLOWO2_01_FULL_35_13]|uniref:CRISPR-associated endoribonuclease Cas2 n=1 Tax=Candidatus Roizmanbacteria bacterium RIFCSPLOWO2_01_FULL_35_13 TaxID=1802055 RepID=A0A1F7I7B8_9BACT|nr:MAG: CRISPR-associated endonuclease Cas2 [Candidatus Roizmanbacteria bacterium RIFCSPLOWO2_01_FULL_35_13]